MDYVNNGITNISRVSLDRWFNFGNNTYVRVRLNIFL